MIDYNNGLTITLNQRQTAALVGLVQHQNMLDYLEYTTLRDDLGAFYADNKDLCDYKYSQAQALLAPQP